MDSQEIRELIELISKSNVQSFELEREGLRLKLVKQKSHTALAGAVSASDRATPTSLAEEAAAAAAVEAADSGLVEVHSPIVGTFYRAPSPSSQNFVEVGVQVSQGQVLCIVEAMKVMNEIDSEIDAEIVEILASNGQPVEYGEVLFRVRPI